MDSPNNFFRSSSLTIGEWICVTCLPLVAVIEPLIFAVGRCFQISHRPTKCSCDFRDLTRLADESLFTVNEVEALHELYKNLSCSIIKDGLIHKEELQLALFQTTYGENLFLERVFDLFDEKKNGVIEFEEFIHAISVFHPSAPVEEKIDFAFRLYDLRQTGFIEREEVKQMVIAILMESDIKLPDDLLEAIIDKTFADADADKDGRINKEEWKDFAVRYPLLLKNMTIPYLMYVTFSVFLCAFVFTLTVMPACIITPVFSQAPYCLEFGKRSKVSKQMITVPFFGLISSLGISPQHFQVLFSTPR